VGKDLTENQMFIIREIKDRPKETPKETPKENITTSNLENRILAAIINNKFITAQKISEKLNISVYTVREYIEKLKKKNILRHVGPTKSGHWEIIER
jgi:ATP-dependent DNA helicase RecG